MRYKIVLLIIVMFFITAALNAQPAVYGGKCKSDSNNSYYSFKARNLPLTTVIRLYYLNNDQQSLLQPEMKILSLVTDEISDSLNIIEENLDANRLYLEFEFSGILYPEMVYIPAGRYAISNAAGKISQFSLNDFIDK